MSVTDVAGIRVGHWTDPVARTGCTVVLLPDGAVVSGEVRGSAPATREFALLDPGCTVQQAGAIVLAGGSAFGLAAADGVMRWLEERGIGFRAPAGTVPIVVAMACYDLAVGDAGVRPGPPEGRAACDAATDGPVALGRVGAGTGATVAKWHDPDERVDAGLGGATIRHGAVTVSALVVLNAAGYPGEVRRLDAPFWAPGTNTSLVVVATDARLDKLGCHLVARSAHDGLARAVDPVHTGLDGDAAVVAATGGVEADLDLTRALAARAVTAAVASVSLG